MIFDAVVLAGGRSSRLGGHPKSELIFEGATLLQRTLDAVRDARQIVIVGEAPSTELSPTTILTRETPRLGGPAAAIAAGLDAMTGPAAEWVVVLACDMPFSARAVPVLVEKAGGDGVLALDADGREQYLLACYRRAALRDAVAANAGSLVGLPVRALISGLSLTGVTVPAGSATDIDTPADAAAFEIAIKAGAHHD